MQTFPNIYLRNVKTRISMEMTNLVLIYKRGHFKVECWHLNIGAKMMRIKKLK